MLFETHLYEHLDIMDGITTISLCKVEMRSRNVTF